MIEDQLTKPISFLIGKNGCGKSTLLRNIANRRKSEINWHVKYITPERGGAFKHHVSVEQNQSNNPLWISDSRIRNQFEQFREQSYHQFRNLELSVLREIEQNNDIRLDTEYTFGSIIGKSTTYCHVYISKELLMDLKLGQKAITVELSQAKYQAENLN